MIFAIKVLISAFVIAGCSWLAGKKPELAGFLTALPLTSLLVLIFAQTEWKDSATSIKYAQSILTAIPVSTAFFVPFLFAKHVNNRFWLLYGIGISLLIIGYFLHSYIMSKFF